MSRISREEWDAAVELFEEMKMTGGAESKNPAAHSSFGVDRFPRRSAEKATVHCASSAHDTAVVLTCKGIAKARKRRQR